MFDNVFRSQSQTIYRRYYMEESGEASASTPNLEDPNHASLQFPGNNEGDAPVIRIPHEILQDVGAQHIFNPIAESEATGMQIIFSRSTLEYKL